jgi:hypothetical protein
MERYKRKNNGGNTQRTPISGFNRFPSLRGDIDWWKDRSKSSLFFPKKMQESRKEWRESVIFSRSTMEERIEEPTSL